MFKTRLAELIGNFIIWVVEMLLRLAKAFVMMVIIYWTAKLYEKALSIFVRRN